ncbi:hypothetical protein [Streptomyces niveus]|uniref:hypothetical protein n=1 Tax=Streptomyces niveus TaxID=193462 RepID=UPI003443DAD2
MTTTTVRLCNAAGCAFRTPVDPADPDTAWDTVTVHYQAAHGMTGPEAGLFGARHSATVEGELPPWEETVEEAARADDRYWERDTDDEPKGDA